MSLGEAGAERVPWSERRFIRALRGGRGRPVGLAFLALLVAGLAAFDGRPLRPLRLAWLDTYQALAPRVRASQPVLIVDIDEQSLKAYGQWPWPRTLLAKLVTRIAAGGPAAVGIDVLMPEPDRLSPERLAGLLPDAEPDISDRLRRLGSNDAALAAVLRGRPVVLVLAGLEAGALPGAPGVSQPPVRVFGGEPRPFLRAFAAALRSVDPIDGAAAGHGLISADPEGGVVRRVPMVAAVGAAVVPSLALEMLRVASGAPSFSVRVGARGIESVGVGDLVVPTQPDGSVWIHYTPHDGDRFVSAREVLTGAADPRMFGRKLVIVGVTALAASDYQATPVTDQMSGPEIHAQVLEGVIDGDLLRRPRWALWTEAAALAAGGLTLILVVPGRSARVSALVLLGVVASTMGLGFGLYLGGRMLFDAALPTAGLGALYTVLLALTLAETDSQRRSLRRQVERQREAAARVAGELEAARRIQMGSLPRPGIALAREERLDVYAFLEPAREVGGDFYDFFPLDADRVFFSIGDVAGKGLPGSLFMAVSKALCKSAALRGNGDVALLMAEANREISRDNGEGLFVTVFAGILDAGTGHLDYCNAGHEPPRLLGRTAGVPGRLAEGGGPPLCVLDDFPYAAGAYRMAAGETLCLVTDGVTEAMNEASEFYGRPRLERLLSGLGAGSAAVVGEAIRDDVKRFTGNAEPADDLAILVVRWRGPERPLSGR